MRDAAAKNTMLSVRSKNHLKGSTAVSKKTFEFFIIVQLREPVWERHTSLVASLRLFTVILCCDTLNSGKGGWKCWSGL